jgi:hypothetical protein
MSHVTRIVSVLLFCVLAGCSQQAENATSFSHAFKGGADGRFDSLPSSNAEHEASLAEAQPAEGGEQGVLAGDPATVTERKIIYVARVSLVVEDFTKIESELPQLVKQFGGYLADTTIDRTQ